MAKTGSGISLADDDGSCETGDWAIPRFIEVCQGGHPYRNCALSPSGHGASRQGRPSVWPNRPTWVVRDFPEMPVGISEVTAVATPLRGSCLPGQAGTGAAYSQMSAGEVCSCGDEFGQLVLQPTPPILGDCWSQCPEMHPVRGSILRPTQIEVARW